MISPTRPRWTPSGLTMTKVRCRATYDSSPFRRPRAPEPDHVGSRRGPGRPAAGQSTDGGSRRLTLVRRGLRVEHAAANLGRGHTSRLEVLDQVVAGVPGIDPIPTGKDVDGCIAVLRPGMDRQVGLGDHDDAADPLRAELMESDLPDLGAGCQGCVDHDLFNALSVVQDLRAAVIHLDQNVTPQGLHRHRPSLRVRELINTTLLVPRGR